jgi:hypothetical protein
MRVMVLSADGFTRLGGSGDIVSDEAGRFLLRYVPSSSITLVVRPVEAQYENYDDVQIRRTVADSGADTADIGDIALLAHRHRPGDPIGALGIGFVAPPAGADPDAREYRISSIDPAGPAARSGLQIGDVIVKVDGYDVTGEGAQQWRALVVAPPSTRLTLETRGGTIATVVLANP